MRRDRKSASAGRFEVVETRRGEEVRIPHTQTGFYNPSEGIARSIAEALRPGVSNTAESLPASRLKALRAAKERVEGPAKTAEEKLKALSRNRRLLSPGAERLVCSFVVQRVKGHFLSARQTALIEEFYAKLMVKLRTRGDF